MSLVVVGRLLGPVDSQVDLVDLGEGPGGVLQPGSDLSVTGVGPDDRVGVTVEDGQAPGVPVQDEPLVRVR